MIEISETSQILALDPAGIREWISTCESAQVNELHEISDCILNCGVKLVALAGPSCSGKTTTAHRLISFLNEGGKTVKVISTDDFFLDVCTYPETEDGVPDFDHFNRLDSSYLASVLRDVTAQKTVLLPTFDFATGKRNPTMDVYTPKEDSIIILEGIHALNDLLYDPSMRYYRLGLNVTKPFVLDQRELFCPREIRLLRRIIRDEKFRSYQAEQTLRIWGNVVRGEINFIVPFFEHTDFFLSTGLAYEPCVWRDDALDSLAAIQPNSPFYETVKSLTDRLMSVPRIDPNLVPKDSILREFIGEINR